MIFGYVIILFYFLAIFTSCNDRVLNQRVEYSLDLAQGNRDALDSVLEHYKKSPQKLKAAKFLIANMPRYYSFVSPQIDSLKKLEREFISKKYFDQKNIKRWGAFDFHECRKKYDIHSISADLLIDNIDMAFKVWQERPWSKYYSFDDFCEYVLPYRIADEPLEKWRTIYYRRYTSVLDSLYKGDDVVEAAQKLALYLKREGFSDNTSFRLPHLGALFLLNNRVGYCRDACDIACYVMRALGIPVAIDMYVVSPRYRLRHFWNALIDTTGKSIPFNYPEKKKIVRKGYDNRKRGKVYRLCFGSQPERFAGLYQCADVPNLFRDPFFKDVTNQYFLHNEIKIKVSDKSEKFVYLSIFNGNQYVPIDVAQVKGGTAVFENIEDSLVYYPVYCHRDNIAPADFPFLLKGCELASFVPDTNRKSKVELQRKYPLLRNRLRTVVGVKVEGANRKDFKNGELLFEVKSIPKINYNSVVLRKIRGYRYIRYAAPKQWWIETAEIMLFEDSVQCIPVHVYSENPIDTIFEKNMWKMFDGDWVTYYMSHKKGEHAIIDLGRKRLLNRIVYIPRNDDNYIHIGDVYELYYHAGIKGWRFLGRKRADSSIMSFLKVPDNAILWLHDVTRGIEERAFYYKGDQQIFP